MNPNLVETLQHQDMILVRIESNSSFCGGKTIQGGNVKMRL